MIAANKRWVDLQPVEGALTRRGQSEAVLRTAAVLWENLICIASYFDIFLFYSEQVLNDKNHVAVENI